MKKEIIQYKKEISHFVCNGTFHGNDVMCRLARNAFLYISRF